MATGSKLSNETKAQIASQMVIMDAIEKGYTNKDEILQYMKSETFAEAVRSYVILLEKEFA
jgi:hypothetical protein